MTQTQTKAKHLFIDCQDWGRGGNYVFDPATGKRQRIDGAAPPQQSTTPVQPVKADSANGNDDQHEGK